MAPIQRFRNSNSPRVIGAVIGAALPGTEEQFLAASEVPASLVSTGDKALVLYPNDTAVLYRRTPVEIPEDDSEPTGPYFDFYREVVSPTNGKYLGSIVSVGAMFDPNTGIPTSPWIRVVGITSLGDGEETSTFGLLELA